MVNSKRVIVDFDSLIAKIQIHLMNNVHVYFIKFRSTDINRIGVNATCKKKKNKKKKTPFIGAPTASLHYPYLQLHTNAEIQIPLGKY